MRLYFILIFLTAFIALSGQTVRFIEQEIKPDGVLDEAVWQEITPLKNFQNFFPVNVGAAACDTDVRIFQDGKYLNIAFVYHDSLSIVRVNSLKRDNYFTGFHLSDCIGVIIDPYNNQNKGYFFAVNGEGAQLDALVTNYDNRDVGWDVSWESGNTVKGTDKIYEIKIPLSSLSYDENISDWSFQFYTRDAKQGLYTVWNNFPREFLQFDTRFLKPLNIENLKPSKTKKVILIPSVTGGFHKDLQSDTEDTNFQPSLDMQYKVSDGLRLDATLNPDFSQVDVDQQVTNLTRFNIVFPERRNFFTENSDMFTTLGAADDINPFYSRFIGASQDILTGLKLSGNVSPNTRIGLLNVQSKKEDFETSQNYTVAAAKQQLGSIFNTTAYFINRQETKDFSFENDYNRVVGLKANYLSKNRKWAGFATYGNSFNKQISGKNHVFSAENNYTTRTLSFSTKVNTVGKNYLTDIGFVPRIYQYDAENDVVTREGYTQLNQWIRYNYFPKNNSIIQTYRILSADVSTYLDESGNIFETNYFYNTALFFANLRSVYLNLYHDDIRLKYAFSPLRDEYLVLPGNYKNSAARIGFNSNFTNSLYGSVNLQFGTFYKGDRTRFGAQVGYRLLPLLNFELNYEYNTLSFDETGNRELHLLGLTGEVFFSNKLNWTTYLQYNQQIDNFNINSRLQWEYKPLSFIYLVFSDNYSESFARKNWGVSVKINRRLSF